MMIAESETHAYAGRVARRKKKGGRGGRRPGAGRKPELSDPVSVTLDLDRSEAEALDSIAAEQSVSRASLVRAAVRTFLRGLGRA